MGTTSRLLLTALLSLPAVAAANQGLAVLFVIALPTANCCQADVAIHVTEHHTNEFGGREITRSFRVESDRPLAGRVVWNVSAEARTLASGERELRVVQATEKVNIAFRLGALRDGVILPVTLSVAVVADHTELARHEMQLWLFPDDPFGPRSQWLQSLDITLFDPAGRTSKQFDKSKVPYRLAHYMADLEASERQGLLIIGEGISTRQHGSLAATALQAAAAGRRVVWLAPAEGSLTVPGTSRDELADRDVPCELRFARQQIITELDKRLDARAWAATDNTVPASWLLLESYRGRVQATVSDDSRGWPWIEVRFAQTGGVLVICGFRIIEHWDASPTPRYLLLRLLESLSPVAMEN